MSFSLHRLIALLAALATLVAVAANANTMHLSTNGTGQVLLFPYYTARSGNVSLMSLVNTTTQAKAVRVNVREARGGFVVARFNVYLSAKDVWTAAIWSDSDGARIATSDTSCTAPSLRSALAFSNSAYLGDAVRFASRDRTREGYVEVIEMATIPNATRMGIAVTHVAGVPPCLRSASNAASAVDVTDAAYEPPTTDLIAPTGGLTGSLSFLNVTSGMLASASPTVIDGFWLTGPNAPAPRAVPANSSAMDLSSGKNTTIAFAGIPNKSATADAAPQYRREAERFTARFATSLDAVSGLLSTTSASSEYAFTQDNTLSTLLMLTMPTKPYYIHAAPVAPVFEPFSAPWDSMLAQSCENIAVAAYTREEVTASTPDDFGTPPARPPSQVCFVANPLVSLTNLFYFVYGLPSAEDPTFFASPIAFGFMAIQNGGAAVPTPGKEGGWAEFAWTSPVAKLQPIEAFVHRRDATGQLVWLPVKATLFGLPVIGFTLSQAAYRTGSPQQNYADAVPLRSHLNVSTIP